MILIDSYPKIFVVLLSVSFIVIFWNVISIIYKFRKMLFYFRKNQSVQNFSKFNSLVSITNLSEEVTSKLIDSGIFRREDPQSDIDARIDRYFLNSIKHRVREMSIHYRGEESYFLYVAYKGSSIEENLVTLNNELEGIKRKNSINFLFKFIINQEQKAINSFFGSKNLDILYYSKMLYHHNLYGKDSYGKSVNFFYLFSINLFYFTWFVFYKIKFFSNLKFNKIN